MKNLGNTAYSNVPQYSENVRRDLPIDGQVIKRGRGIFIKADCNETVYSTSSGTVIYSGNDIREYGWLVIVQRDNGMMHVYGNLSKISVKKRDHVEIGSIIGFSGRNKEGICGVIYEVRTAEGDPIKVR